ncbi:MAG: RNA-binding S4 domain-containing protein, partial [Gammaproteobacteria bacterium]|nr:RNA-binding S4 domain-containing protein [Gammaproteobacteria bacterium]
MPKNNEKTDDLIRLDKWLWSARFYKTRSIAADALKTGKITANGERAKPSKSVKPGDILNIRKGPYRYTYTVLGLAKSRQSATGASLLFKESPESISERELLASQLKAEAALTPSTKGR